jgi:hypothetical protein
MVFVEEFQAVLLMGESVSPCENTVPVELWRCQERGRGVTLQLCSEMDLYY